MSFILNTLINICRFSAKPQDLPASYNILIKTIFATLILFIIRNSNLIHGHEALFLSITQIFLIGVGLRILLVLFNKSDRWLQSATALYGCSSIVLAVILPVLLMISPIDISSESLTFSKLFILISSMWYFSLVVFVLKETLDIKVVLAVLIATVMEITMTIILLILFPNTI